MGFTNPMLQHDEGEWSSERPVAIETGHRGQSKTLWGSIVLMAAALGAIAYYGYHMVRDQDAQITQLFGSQGTLTTLGQRADAAESKLHDLAGNWDGMGQRVTKLEGTVTASVRETRHYAETLTQQLHEQMTTEMAARTSSLDTHISQVESEQEAQRAQIAQLEASLKQDISTVREENGRDLSGVRGQEETNAREVGALSQKLDRERVDFELAKGQTKELAPGISLQIQGVNPARERYHGTLSLAQDHRTLWLRDESAHQPVRFFPVDGGDAYELIVTSVAKKAVAGYLLVPVKPGAEAGALADQPATVAGSGHE